jgi:ribonucleoside-diphosphate reductase alpha chain
MAIDIVSQKYFRRRGCNQRHPNSLYNSAFSRKWTKQLAHDDGDAEHDIRQVIHRLVGCWTDWGNRHNYFSTKKDSQAFYDEMSYMLATQMFAPNSPQWFNAGLFRAYGMIPRCAPVTRLSAVCIVPPRMGSH